MTSKIKPTVLVVEDSPSHAHLIHASLCEDYNVLLAPTVGDALSTLVSHPADVVLLDIMLPDGDGYQLCSILRQNPQTKDVPVLFLSARADVNDKVMGFSLGADDYITKPVAPQELRARVQARIRRVNQDSALSLPGLEFNFVLQTISVESEQGWSELDLTPREYKLLSFLARNREAVLSREEILKAVWGDKTHVTDRSIDTHIASIRKKLGPVSRYIKSIHGTGYRFTVDSAESFSKTA